MAQIGQPRNSGCLFWSLQFARDRNEQMKRKQQFIDSEVLRHCDPLVPFKTGKLKESGKLGTKIGSGEVCYIAPYADFQYRRTAQSRPYDPNRGAMWFERMKVSHKEEILAGAKKV